MKKYLAPVLEVSKFDAVDIITVSVNVPAVLSPAVSDTLKYKGYDSTDLEWEINQ